MQQKRTSLISQSILLIIIFTTFSSNLILIKAQTNLPPNPYITSPSNNGFMETTDPNIVKVFESQVEIRVVNLTEENDIIADNFEFSFDGIIWNPIGEDINKNFEGIQFNGNNGLASTNGWAEQDGT